MGKIYYVMGKSASGKDTIYRRLKESFPDLKSVVQYTTRPIREGETEGVEYHFTDEEGFRKLKESGKLIEQRAYHTVLGIWRYGTADDGQIDLARESYLVIGTLESYEKMLAYFGGEKLFPIYIEVEDGERLERAISRERKQEHPKYAEVCRRFLADAEDFKEENLRKLNIRQRFENTEIETCFSRIAEVIKNDRI